MVAVEKTALTLWGFSASSATNRVRIALAMKKIPFTFRPVDIPNSEQRSEEYSNTKNKLQQVPLLQVGNDGSNFVMLRQSLPILEYLDEAYPDTTPLLPPDDPVQRARIREVAEIVNSLIQPMQNKLTVEKVAELNEEFAAWLQRALKAHAEGETKIDATGDSKLKQWPQWWIHRGFVAIESLIDDDPNAFCFGNTVTMADCALIPQVLGARKYFVPLDEFPKITRVYAKVTALPEIQKGLRDILKM